MSYVRKCTVCTSKPIQGNRTTNATSTRHTKSVEIQISKKSTHSEASEKTKLDLPLEVQKQVLTELARELNIQKLDEWSNFTLKGLKKEENFKTNKQYQFIMRQHKGSLVRALQTVFPEHEWKPWMFDQVPKHFWEDKNNQRQFFDWAFKQLNLKSLSDWYNIKYEDMRRLGGKTLVHKFYDCSVGNGMLMVNIETNKEAVMALYPEYPWKPWLFKKTSRVFWDNPENTASFLSWMADQCGVISLDDWYNVSREQFRNSGGSALLKKYGSVVDVLKHFFPHHPWKRPELMLGKFDSKAQLTLHKIVTNIFGGKEEVLMNYHHPQVVDSAEFELDVFVPKYFLALEYQGEQHYSWHFLYGEPGIVQQRDETKRELCRKAGITLIEVPFWWKRDKMSVVALICQARPELFNLISQNLPGISLESLEKQKMMFHSTSLKVIRNRNSGYFFSESAKFPAWDLSKDPTKYLVSSAVQGVRLLWDGKSDLYTDYSQKVLNVPPEFMASLPSIPLDIEVFYNHYNTTSEILSQKDYAQWSKLQIRILDSPIQPHLKFPDRYQFLMHYFQTHPEFSKLKIASFTECQGAEHFNQMLHENPFGLLLKNPATAYFDHRATYQYQKGETADGVVLKVTENSLECQLYVLFAISSHLSRLSGEKLTVPKPAHLTTTLSPNTIVSIDNSSSSTPSISHVKKHLDWNVISSESRVNSPYWVREGGNSGAIPKCRCCSKLFTDRSELRIEIKGLFKALQSTTPTGARYSVCLSQKCLEGFIVKQGQKQANTNHAFGILIPAFHGQIGVPKDIMERDDTKAKIAPLSTAFGKPVEWTVL